MWIIQHILPQSKMGQFVTIQGVVVALAVWLDCNHRYHHNNGEEGSERSVKVHQQAVWRGKVRRADGNNCSAWKGRPPWRRAHLRARRHGCAGAAATTGIKWPKQGAGKTRLIQKFSNQHSSSCFGSFPTLLIVLYLLYVLSTYIYLCLLM